MSQQTFNPIKIGFEWTVDGWYNWDRKAAHKAALQARNKAAKELERQGKRVIKSSMANQLVRCGGIGSGHPDIEQVVTVYILDVM